MSRALNTVLAELLASWLHYKQLKSQRQRIAAAAVRTQMRAYLDQLVELLLAAPGFGAIETYAYRVAERHLRQQSIDPPMRRLLQLIEAGAFGDERESSRRGWNRVRLGVRRCR